MVIHRRSKVSIVKVKTVKWEFNLGKDRNTEWTKDMLHIDDFAKKKKKMYDMEPNIVHYCEVIGGVRE